MTSHPVLARTFAMLTLLLPAAVAAGTIQFSGEVSWTRYTTGMALDGDGRCTGEVGERSLPYEAHSFSVDTTGVYAVREHVDPRYLGVYVYAGSFDPAAPAVHCIAASFASPVRLAVPLVAGATYTVVVVEWDWDVLGLSYRVSVDGPGTILGPCAGFVDVGYTDLFCRSIEWARNRSVTRGCTTTQFCPLATPNRLQVVAMLYRLATSLEPEFLVASDPDATDGAAAGGILCQTPVYAVTGFPRTATVTSAAVRHRAASATEVRTNLAIRLDSGSWHAVAGLAATATNLPGSHATQWPMSAPIALDRGRWVAFGIQALPAGTVDEAACALTVRLDAAASDPYPPAHP